MADGSAEREQAQRAFLEQLVEARLLIPLGVPGVYGRSGVFENIIRHVEDLITRSGADTRAEVMRFPPLLSRAAYEATDHLETMANLLGSVHSFEGGDPEYHRMVERHQQRQDWTGALTPTDVVLVPAACYPLYPTASGTLPSGGRTVDLLSFVFRHEPSDDPVRMQIFRQREYVRLGTPAEALAHRDLWLERGERMLRSLGLPATPVLANDPFFGRGARVMKATQREQKLKYELVVAITSEAYPTAIASCSYHQDHFGLAFTIRTADGKVAHSACIGFGLERIALALLRTHGLDPSTWPAAVKRLVELA